LEVISLHGEKATATFRVTVRPFSHKSSGVELATAANKSLPKPYILPVKKRGRARQTRHHTAILHYLHATTIDITRGVTSAKATIG